MLSTRARYGYYILKRGTCSLRLGGLLAVAASVVIWPLFGGPGMAHAEVVVAVSSSPADGSVVAASPPSISVTFNQNVGSAAKAIIACNGNPAPQSAARVSDDLRSLVVDIAATPLPKGQCQVLWQVQGLAEAGTSSGSFSFKVQQDTVATVAIAAAATPTATTTATGAPAAANAAANGAAGVAEAPNVGGPLGLARLLSSLTIAALFGGLVLITVAWPEGVEYILTIRYLRYAWLLAVASTVVMVICLTAQVTGKSFTASLSPTSWLKLADARPAGVAALARLVLVAAAGWVAVRPERVIDPATQLPALALPGLAVATMGFSRSGGDLALVGYAAGMTHALAMAVWIGGLLLLARVVLAGPGEDDLAHAVRGFSRFAAPALLITVATGAIQLYRLDSGHLFDTTHGRLMLLKVVPVFAMVFVGVATRQFIRARVARAEVMTAPMAGRLRRAIGMEAAFGVAVLAITAWMLASPPGNLQASALSTAGFASHETFKDPDAKFEVTLAVDPAKVGPNALLFEVKKPLTGISSIQVRFEPPVNTTANAVVWTITNLPGIGGAYLPQSVGIPLGVAGAWSVTVDVVAAAGTLHSTELLDVKPNGVGSIAPLPTVTQPLVTSPPDSGAPSTTVRSG